MPNSDVSLRNYSLYWRSRNTTVTSDFRPEVEIWPFRACAVHPAIIIGTVSFIVDDAIGRSTERISS